MKKYQNKHLLVFATVFAIGLAIIFFKFFRQKDSQTIGRAGIVQDNPINDSKNVSEVITGVEETINVQNTETQADSAELFPNLPSKVQLDIPFTPQAPTGRWSDIRQGNGCEEASLLMVMQWISGKKISPQAAEKEITGMSEYSLKSYGHFHDESNEDTLRLLKDYFRFENAYLRENISREEIRFELSRGNAVIVPINALKLGNPYYQLQPPGNHKLVVTGYDDVRQEFITNDPGTSRGAGFRYRYEKLENALMDYPTGYHASFETLRKSMLVVQKK